METFDAYVRGIPLDVNRHNLEQLFKEFGEIRWIAMKTKPGASDKTAFVKFINEDSLVKAIDHLNGAEFHGAILGVARGKKSKRSGHSGYLPTKGLRPKKAERDSCDGSGKGIQLLVTHVESPFEVWAQVDELSTTRNLALLTQTLNNHCTSNPPSVTEVINDEIYGALFSADSVYYRCQVINQPNDHEEEVLIRYIDYGNTESVPVTALVSLPHSLKEEPYAVKYRIANLQAVGDDAVELKGTEFLKNLILDQSVQVTLKAQDADGGFEVEVILPACERTGYSSVNLSKRLAEEGYALPCMEFSYRPSMVQPTDQFLPESPSPSETYSSPPSHNAWDGLRSREGCLNRIEALEYENSKLKDVLEKTHEEHSTAILEAIDQGMEFQIAKLVDKVHSLKDIRSCVPLESSSPPVIERAIQLVLNEEEKIEVAGLTEMSEVKKAAEKFSEAQEAIKNCTDKSLVAELVSHRDQARIELSDAINAFLVHAQQKLGLQSREQVLQNALSELKEVFPELLCAEDTLSIGKTVQEYQQWVARSTLQIKAVCKNSTIHSQEVFSALQTLQQLLSLDSPISVKLDLPSFTELFKEYSATIDTEVERLKHSSNTNLLETEEVRMVAKHLIAALEKELEDIRVLRESTKHYAQLQAAVDQWLVAKPELGLLQTCRKVMRKLRIEFGHKMVEKKELLQDEDVEELEEVEAELSHIRVKLHKAFIDETAEMLSHAFQLGEAEELLICLQYWNIDADLSELCALIIVPLGEVAAQIDQFPELQMQYPELNLQTYVSSGGLLKSGRSIEHFERLEELPLVDQPAFRSTFNHELCVFKEFHLSSPDVLHTIITNAQTLNKVQDAGVVSVMAIFRDGANKVYVQLSNYGTVNLVSWIESKREPEAILTVFSQVLQALAVMHSKGVVYGSLKASSIWVTAQESKTPHAILGEFDLDKELDSRFSLATAPECKSEVVTSATDVYCFGKTLLWSFQPDGNLVHDPEGNPRLAKFSLPAVLRSLLEGLLHSNPKLRLSAATAMTHPFFTPVIPPTPPGTPEIEKEADEIPDPEIISTTSSQGEALSAHVEQLCPNMVDNPATTEGASAEPGLVTQAPDLVVMPMLECLLTEDLD